MLKYLKILLFFIVFHSVEHQVFSFGLGDSLPASAEEKKEPKKFECVESNGKQDQPKEKAKSADVNDGKKSSQNTGSLFGLSSVQKIFSYQYLKQKIQSVNWFHILSKILSVFVILFLAKLFWKILNIAIESHLSKILSLAHGHRNSSVLEKTPLLKTIIPIIKSISQWALVIVVSLIILSDLGVDVTPILVSFSVLGLALSFGSQELVKDLINGVLTLFDGNIAVGDFIKVGASSGVVETMSLRAIVLRYASGELQTIPFSEAKSITNCSRDYTMNDVTVSLTPEANTDLVQKAYDRVLDQMKQDEEWKNKILSTVSGFGITKMDTNGIVVVASIKTIPDPGKGFLAEFNLRLLKELQRLNVPLAYLTLKPQ